MPKLIHTLLLPLYEWANIATRWSGALELLLSLFLFIVVALVLSKLSLLFLNKIIRWFVQKSKTKWDDYLYEANFFRRTSRLLASCIIYFFIPLFLPPESFIIIFARRLVLAYLAVLSAHIAAAFFDGVNLIYQDKAGEQSKRRPIKGYLQLVKIGIYLVGGILALTTMFNKSPVGILSGLGAMSAVLLLIFKDSIMGFVSGIQLAGNDMVRIGDWIEMPKHGADGNVIDVTLQSVVVENFDLSVVTIPIYSLVSDSFRNWRNLNKAKGRRIKRWILIDLQSVHFLSNDEIEKLSKLQLLSDYLKDKCAEIEAHNKTHNISDEDHVCRRRLTNIGTFRIYAQRHLKSLDRVAKNMPCIVRHLQPEASGLPIELTCFSIAKDSEGYENLQADIFDHLLAVMREFGLSIFQNPSGSDLRNLQNAPNDNAKDNVFA